MPFQASATNAWYTKHVEVLMMTYKQKDGTSKNETYTGFLHH